jgi:hypothetical protein
VQPFRRRRLHRSGDLAAAFPFTRKTGPIRGSIAQPLHGSRQFATSLNYSVAFSLGIQTRTTNMINDRLAHQKLIAPAFVFAVWLIAFVWMILLLG